MEHLDLVRPVSEKGRQHQGRHSDVLAGIVLAIDHEAAPQGVDALAERQELRVGQGRQGLGLGGVRQRDAAGDAAAAAGRLGVLPDVHEGAPPLRRQLLGRKDPQDLGLRPRVRVLGVAGPRLCGGLRRQALAQGFQVLLRLHQPVLQRPEHPDGHAPRQEAALATLGRRRQARGVRDDGGHGARGLRPPAVPGVVVRPGRPPPGCPALVRVPDEHRLRREHREAVERHDRAPELPLAGRGQGSLDIADALDLEVISEVRVSENVHVRSEPLHSRLQVVGPHRLGQARRYEVPLLRVHLQARHEVGEGEHGFLLGPELQQRLHVEDLVVDPVHELGG
mmetsp:Transcript_33472/g.103937  ORF Transcript_33472/g.103937 Transcript_33472/m.103937 type:complete len:337 (+) Transcript_33472:163-1173(+)